VKYSRTSQQEPDILFAEVIKKKDACEDVSLLVMVLRLARLLPLQVLWPWVRRQRDARIEASGMRER
jgi:hypothetical protein